MIVKLSRSDAGKLGYAKAKTKLLAIAKERRQKSIEDYSSNKKLCKGCKKEIPYIKRANNYCSRNCSANINNTKRLVNRCLNCNELIHKPKKYCNNTCQQTYKWQAKLSEIETTGSIPSKDPRMAKRFLKEACGHRCSICATTEWQNKKLTMILDHINGNSTDWKIENLRLLCPNCDSQTDTWKGRNRGNGRHIRRQRYKEGKSY